MKWNSDGIENSRQIKEDERYLIEECYWTRKLLLLRDWMYRDYVARKIARSRLNIFSPRLTEQRKRGITKP